MIPSDRSGVSPSKELPDRTYYQILDISPVERDPKTIEEAALRCSSQTRVYQLTRESECTRQLNEIADALNTLLDPALRCEYDLQLTNRTIRAPSEAQTPGKSDAASTVQTISLPRASEGRSVLFRLEAGHACDVRLVYRRRAV